MNPELSHSRDNLISLLDRNFRNPQGLPSRAVNAISPRCGTAYLDSLSKRMLDLAISTPLAVAAVPLILILAGLAKAEDGGPMFFTQERVGDSPGKTIKLIKIRCMTPGSDRGMANLNFAYGRRPQDDPRCTRLGQFMREYELEELPQLFQVILGELSLVGNRPLASYVFAYLKKKWSSERFSRWESLYYPGKKGLSGLRQLFDSELHHMDEKRFHHDVFYAQNATLGLDLYLIWRTMVKLTRLLPPGKNGKIKK